VRAREQRARQELYRQLDERFDGQSVDRDWQRPTETKLLDALEAIGSEGTLWHKVECRSDICKTTIAHDLDGPNDDLVSAFVAQRLPFEHHFRHEPRQTIIYTLRAP
jgi:hypothetical protein